MASPDRKTVRHRKKGPPRDGSGDFEKKPPLKEAVARETRFRRLFGFDLEELQSWSAFVQLLNRPADPANLGVLRVLFGFLMVLDVMQERGMSNLDHRFGDPDACHFPLFNFLYPLPIDWLYIVYLVMLIGAIGIMLGFCFRVSCLCFLGPYWYIFFLDKTVWNNHSYLYGLTAFLLLSSSANHYWSIDGLLNKKLRNSHVPLWNYTLFRFQIFIVYFLAGLKKLDEDWVTGNSMTRLSKHWVFAPFTMFLSEEFVNHWIVHMGGLIIDLTMGYLLFFDITRPIGFFFGGSFHVMNSQMFHIGMFSYTMLATLPLFSAQDWPKRLVHRCPDWMKTVLPLDTPAQDSRRCLYTKDIKEDSQAKTGKQKRPPTRWVHHLSAVFVLLYMSEQLFLPYSHFITQGYNSWTQGLYGYSWDMMVHTWSVQHIKVKYVDAATGDTGYLRPGVFTSAKRWSSHPDMLKQYATCLRERLQEHGIEQPQFYFDIWKSMNHRFQQRMVDPRVDIVSADWSPFKASPWMLPLLMDLTPWREKFEEIEETMANETEVVFVADFPGLELENYINSDFDNVSLTVLNGEVRVEFRGKENNESLKNVTLKKDEKLEIPSGEFHNVLTTSQSPSCYYYVSTNQTAVEFNKNITEYMEKQNASAANTTEDTISANDSSDDPLMQKYQRAAEWKKRRELWNTNLSQLDYFKVWGIKKYFTFRRSLLMGGLAVRNIVFGTPEVEQLAADLRWAAGEFNPEKYMDELAGVPMTDNP